MPVGTVIKVTADGTGNYKGMIEGEYRITSSSISKAKVKVAAQIYTGEEICPGKDELTVTVGGIKLGDDDYEIISYSNNIKKGNATMVIKGVGNYGGTKTVKFKIQTRKFLWWWRG